MGLFNPYVLLGGLVGLIIWTGAVWIKATGVANDYWAAKVAAATEQVRQEQAERNAATLKELQAQFDEQMKAREAAEKRAEDLRNAFAADKSDAVFPVSPELDRLFCRAVGGRGRGGPCADTSE